MYEQIQEYNILAIEIILILFFINNFWEILFGYKFVYNILSQYNNYLNKKCNLYIILLILYFINNNLKYQIPISIFIFVNKYNILVLT